MTRGAMFGWAFGAAFLSATGLVLLPAALDRFGPSRPTASISGESAPQPLTDGISVTGQITVADLARFQAQGFRRIIDLRPDGEAPEQPAAAEVDAAAKRLGMSFSYVPVPHGDMPDAVADQLTAALSAGEGPVLLYCRSGRRAARAWALAEASRTGGLGTDAIQSRVSAVGQTTEDITERLRARVAARVISN